MRAVVAADRRGLERGVLLRDSPPRLLRDRLQSGAGLGSAALRVGDTLRDLWAERAEALILGSYCCL